MAPTATRTPGSSSIRGLGAVLLVCLGLLAGCKAELFGKVDEADANAALNILYSEGITATKSSVGDDLWRVEVDENDHQRALQVTRNQGVPRERFVSMGELFKKEGLVSTPSEVRMRYIYAVSQELSNTLSQIDGVISARVHPVIPVNDPLSDKVQPSSAAVFIKHLSDADLQQMAPAIKTLVTRSIEGLKVDNVSLTFFASRAPVQAMPAAPAGLLPGDPVVSSLALLLACCLAVTWGVLGWRLWRKPSRQGGTSSLAAMPRQRAPAPTRDDLRRSQWFDPPPVSAPLDSRSSFGAVPQRFGSTATEDVTATAEHGASR
jgi:type III secretion protein J